MPEEDWELIPHQILADLRDEVQALKKKLDQPSTRKEVIKSNDELRKSIQQMQKVFEQALSQVEKEEDSDVMKLLEKIEKQNNHIAKTLASITEGVDGKMTKPSPKPAPLPMAPPPVLPQPQPAFQPRPTLPQPPQIPRTLAPPPFVRITPKKPFPPRPPRRMPYLEEPSFLPPPRMGLPLPPMGLPPPPPVPEKKGLLGKLFK